MALQHPAQVQTMQRRATGPVGTAGRFLVGLGLLYLGITQISLKWELAWHEALLGLLVFPAVTILGVLLWKALAGTSAPIRATGFLGLCSTTGVLGALFAVPFTGDAAALFLGSALLLAAIRGYAGCEVTAISNWLLRRDDQVGCLVFSPLDAAESHFSRRLSEARL